MLNLYDMDHQHDNSTASGVAKGIMVFFEFSFCNWLVDEAMGSCFALMNTTEKVDWSLQKKLIAFSFFFFPPTYEVLFAQFKGQTILVM